MTIDNCRATGDHPEWAGNVAWLSKFGESAGFELNTKFRALEQKKERNFRLAVKELCSPIPCL